MSCIVHQQKPLRCNYTPHLQLLLTFLLRCHVLSFHQLLGVPGACGGNGLAKNRDMVCNQSRHSYFLVSLMMLAWDSTAWAKCTFFVDQRQVFKLTSLKPRPLLLLSGELLPLRARSAGTGSWLFTSHSMCNPTLHCHVATHTHKQTHTHTNMEELTWLTKSINSSLRGTAQQKPSRPYRCSKLLKHLQLVVHGSKMV